MCVERRCASDRTGAASAAQERQRGAVQTEALYMAVVRRSTEELKPASFCGAGHEEALQN
jgi:hypothetical protein